MEPRTEQLRERLPFSGEEHQVRDQGVEEDFVSSARRSSSDTYRMARPDICNIQLWPPPAPCEKLQASIRKGFQ